MAVGDASSVAGEARWTNLALHAYDLHSIANAVEKLQTSGVRVEAAIIGQHRVTLRWHTEGVDQREGPYYTVTSIEHAPRD